MGIFSFIQGKTGKLILHRLYGWGAAAVIMGALFKLMHWGGASQMLIIGMSTECVIFFLSAFEPMPKEYDWSLVFPELDDDDSSVPKGSSKDNQIASTTQRQQSIPANTGVSASGGNVGSNFNLDIDAQTSSDLKSGIQKLSNSLTQMGALSGIVEASGELTNNMKHASGSMIAVSESANILTDNYQKTAQTMNTFNDQTKIGLEQIHSGYETYRTQLEKLGTTMSAVNSSYELYLQETKKVQGDYGSLHTELEKLIQTVQNSSGQTQQFANQMDGLNNSIEQLNSIYGSMLTAVNSVVNK